MPSFETEVELGASAPRLWLALKDSATVFPKIAPQLVASIEHVEGPTEDVGAVRCLKFGSLAPEGAFVKEKLIFIDHADYTATTEEVEGGHLVKGFTKWSVTTKFLPIDDKSCKLKLVVEYECGVDATAHITQAKEGIPKLFQGLAGYVNASGAYA